MRKRIRKYVISFLLCAIITMTIPGITASAMSTITNPSNASGYSYSNAYASKLDEIFNGTAKLFSNSDSSYPLGSSLEMKTKYEVANRVSGWQCYIYANAVYYYLFGDIPFHGDGEYCNNSETVLRNCASVSYDLFRNAGVSFGAYLRTTTNSDGSYNGSNGHSMIILSYDSSQVSVLEGNADGKGLVRITNKSWSEFNSSFLTNKGRRVSHVVQYNGTSDFSSTLDINGYLDGADSGNLSNYGTFDVWINGSKVSDDVNDFCSEYPAGTTYRIDDIKSSGIHTYHGVKNGSLEGTIQNQRVDVSLIFRTNDPVGDDFYAYITSRGGDLQLVSSSGASDNVGAEANSTSASHVWHFHRLNSNNEYKITSAVDGRTLDVLNYGQESGTNLQLRDYSGNTAQTWIIHEENGYVEIGAKCTPCVIDCGQSASNGKFNAYMSREWWNDYQWFKLDKISNYQPPAVAVSTNKSSYKLGETVTISWAEPTGYDVWVYGIRRNSGSTYYVSNYGTSGTTSTWKPTETGTYTLEFAYRSLEGVTSKLSTCTFVVLDEEVKISFNKQNISMKSGETTELVVSFSGNNIASLGITSDNNSICTPTVSGANWVAYPGTCTATVNLKASSLGTTKITFSLYDSSKKVIQSLNTTVTVTGYYIDLNGSLDGTVKSNLGDFGRADIYINGSLVQRSVSDYYQQWPKGTTYEIKKIIATEGYQYTGSSSISGTVGNSNVGITLPFIKTYLIDLNATLDGQKIYNITGIGRAALYINNESISSSAITDYNGRWPSGTKWQFLVVPEKGYEYHPNGSTNLSGTITNSDIETVIMFTTTTYRITYNANGGSGAPGNQTKTHNVALTLSNTKPTRANSSAGSYKVTLNANGGSVSTASLDAARTTSYTFKNWNTEANGSGTSYNPGASYTANSAATLYAQWESSTTTASVTLPAPTRNGYAFKGWATSSSATSGSTGSYKPTGNITLYAVWQKLQPDFTLPSNLREIGEEAFSGGAFTYVHVSDNVTKIGPRAFADCPNLRNIDIPSGTTGIDPTAFSGVSNLTIHGTEGSYAEFYAQKFGFVFVTD